MSEIGNEVIVTRKTKAPVDQSKTKKGVLDNLLFCNKLDVIYDQKIEDFPPVIFTIFVLSSFSSSVSSLSS